MIPVMKKEHKRPATTLAIVIALGFVLTAGAAAASTATESFETSDPAPLSATAAHSEAGTTPDASSDSGPCIEIYGPSTSNPGVVIRPSDCMPSPLENGRS